MRALLRATHELVTYDEAKEIIAALVKRAKHGDLKCAQLLFAYLEGTPIPMERDSVEQARPIVVNMVLTTAEPEMV